MKSFSVIMLVMVAVTVAAADDCDVPMTDITFGGFAAHKTETFEECKALCRDIEQ